jgi:hypothetical protein
MIKLMSYKKDAIGEETIDEYVKYYSTPGGMSAGFNYYRALKEDASFVETFKGEKLTMPVLTITGAHSTGDKLSKALAGEALLLQSIIVEDSGHFVAEESPEKFNSSVSVFLKNKNLANFHETQTEVNFQNMLFVIANKLHQFLIEATKFKQDCHCNLAPAQC